MEDFFTAGAVLLRIVIAAIGLIAAAVILSVIYYGLALAACKIKRRRRKRKLERSMTGPATITSPSGERRA